MPLQYITLDATIRNSPLGLGVPAYQSFVAIMGLAASYIIWAPPSSAGPVFVSILPVGLVIVGLTMLCYRQSLREKEQGAGEARGEVGWAYAGEDRGEKAPDHADGGYGG